jgi:exonuclease-1
MGIKGLKQFIRSKFPSCIIPSHISHWNSKKVAIDLLPYLYKYKTTYGDLWRNGLCTFLSIFIKHNVHATMIMDGPNIYKEKDEEKERRKESRNKIKIKREQLERDVKQYEIDKTVTPLLLSVSENESTHKNLLLSTPMDSVNVESVYQYIEKLKNQMVIITPHDISIVQELCTSLGITFYYSCQEAESFCSYLCKTGQVDACVTEDTDVLAYGCPHWISSLSHDGMCSEIHLDQVLEDMKLSYDKFIDFCILNSSYLIIFH